MVETRAFTRSGLSWTPWPGDDQLCHESAHSSSSCSGDGGAEQARLSSVFLLCFKLINWIRQDGNQTRSRKLSGRRPWPGSDVSGQEPNSWNLGDIQNKGYPSYSFQQKPILSDLRVEVDICIGFYLTCQKFHFNLKWTKSIHGMSSILSS